MHILFLRQHFPTPDAPGSSRPYAMARSWVDAGHRVTMVVSSARISDAYRSCEPTTVFDLDGIEVRALRGDYENHFSTWQRLRSFWSFARRASAEAKKVADVDVVFASSTPLTIALPGIAARKHHRCPMVFEVRDLWPEMPIAVGVLRDPVSKWLARRLELWAYRGASRIIALSPGMKDGVVKRGIPAERVEVIPNFSDCEQFGPDRVATRELLERHPELGGRKLITYVGTLGRLNDAAAIVPVASKCADLDPSIAFVIVGDGAQRARLEQLARASNVLGKNLFLLPPISKEEVPNLLAHSTLAMSLFRDIPEMRKNSANKFFDALAAGKPVLLNYGGWHQDLVEQYGVGLAIDTSAAERAAKSIVEYCADSRALEEAGSRARSLGLAKFSRSKLCNATLSILEEEAARWGCAKS